MANQSWVSLLNPASPLGSGAGTALNTAATATLSPVTGSTADVAQVQPSSQPYGWYAGLLVRVTASGFITTTGTSTTATWFLASRVGNSGSTYVTLATTAGLTTGTGSLTGLQWTLTALVRCTSIATTGSTVSTQGTLNIVPVAAQTIPTGSADINLSLPNASGETAAAVDTTQLQGISLRGTLAGANATIQLTQWLVEALD
jgi:hypothetical protein